MNFVYENIERENYDQIKSILTKNIGNPVLQEIDQCIPPMPKVDNHC